jgi:hypothetical protein
MAKLRQKNEIKKPVQYFCSNYYKITASIFLGVPLLRRVGALRASLRSVLRTLRPSMPLTQTHHY